MENNEFQIKIKEFKKMDDPREYNIKNSLIKYVGYIRCSSLSEGLEEWMETNPREQNIKSKVSKSIIESLEDEEIAFHDLNRGMVFSVDNIYWDNKTQIAKIYFLDKKRHGNIDGGHTLKCILSVKKEQSSNLDDKYVFAEFYTGINDVTKIAESRNKFQQVDDVSIEELNDGFESIKKLLNNVKFFDSKRVIYKQNDNREDKIHILEIISIINMFNIDLYPIDDDKFPIESYSGKAASFKKFIQQHSSLKEREIYYSRMSDFVTKLFELYEEIETSFASINKNKHYGKKPYSKYKDGNIVKYSLIKMTEMQYDIPNGILYPVLGSFRCLVKKDANGNYCWAVDPIDLWNKIGSSLVQQILEKSENTGNSPNALGKNNDAWKSLFDNVSSNFWKRVALKTPR